MNIWHERIPETSTNVIHISGRLDQSLNAELEEVISSLLDADGVDLIIDLTDASYINSGGLRTLVSAWRKARSQGGSVAICGLNPRLDEIFKMVGFDQVFDVFPDCRSARARARSQQS